MKKARLHDTQPIYKLTVWAHSTCQGYLGMQAIHHYPHTHLLVSELITTMNSVFELPTLFYPALLSHSFKATEPSSLSQPWLIKMVGLPPLNRNHHRDESDVHDHVSKDSPHATHSSHPRSRSSIANLDKELTHHEQPREQRTTLFPAVSTSTPPDLPLPSPSSASSFLETYLCTFCWHPHHQSTSPSCIVGRRARLACTTCYNALLDLAVC